MSARYAQEGESHLARISEGVTCEKKGLLGWQRVAVDVVVLFTHGCVEGAIVACPQICLAAGDSKRTCFRGLTEAERVELHELAQSVNRGIYAATACMTGLTALNHCHQNGIEYIGYSADFRHVF